jgi:uncharacterized damage-inducible protein DinB
MNADAFRHLYGYHLAENRAIWEKYIVQITDEQLTSPLGYSHGAIRDQLIHLIDVDDVWLSELQGIAPLDPLDPATAGREQIRAHAERVEQRVRAYLAALRDEMLLTTPITDPEEDKDLIVWQVLLHVVNHGTDHRAQLLRSLSDMGVKTAAQDYIFYVYDNPQI